jgi:hypothetical protein
MPLPSTQNVVKKKIRAALLSTIYFLFGAELSLGSELSLIFVAGKRIRALFTIGAITQPLCGQFSCL